MSSRLAHHHWHWHWLPEQLSEPNLPLFHTCVAIKWRENMRSCAAKNLLLQLGLMLLHRTQTCGSTTVGGGIPSRDELVNNAWYHSINNSRNCLKFIQTSYNVWRSQRGSRTGSFGQCNARTWSTFEARCCNWGKNRSSAGDLVTKNEIHSFE